MKRVNRILSATLVAGALVAGSGGTALADQGVAIGSGNTATANLNFRVIIPTLTRLRIGNPAAINRIDFDMGAIGAPTPGDGVDVVTGNGGSGGFPVNNTSVTVQLITTVAGGVTVTQTPAAANLIGAVVGNTIPWTQILINDNGGAFSHSMTGGGLSAAAGPIFIAGPGVFDGNWTFAYDNAIAFPADTYNGTMVYTASNP